jgi:ATP-dependent helicase YprA (DUF1998 family)
MAIERPANMRQDARTSLHGAGNLLARLASHQCSESLQRNTRGNIIVMCARLCDEAAVDTSILAAVILALIPYDGRAPIATFAVS